MLAVKGTERHQTIRFTIDIVIRIVFGCFLYKPIEGITHPQIHIRSALAPTPRAHMWCYSL